MQRLEMLNPPRDQTVALRSTGQHSLDRQRLSTDQHGGGEAEILTHCRTRKTRSTTRRSPSTHAETRCATNSSRATRATVPGDIGRASMHSTLNVVHTHTFSRSCRRQLPAAIHVMVDESTQRVAILVAEEALHNLDGSNMVRRSAALLLPCLPSGELVWRAAMGLHQEMGARLLLPLLQRHRLCRLQDPLLKDRALLGTLVALTAAA